MENEKPQSTNVLMKAFMWYRSRTTKAKVFLWFIVIVIIGGIANDKNSSSSPSNDSSSSSSSGSHTCGQCGKAFSGNGWSTVGGEQFEQSSWSGSGYCSKSCAYESQPSNWKKK